MNEYTVPLGPLRLPAVPSHGAPVAIVVLDAAALDFLVTNLPESDGFTQDLERLRERAKEELWSRQ